MQIKYSSCYHFHSFSILYLLKNVSFFITSKERLEFSVRENHEKVAFSKLELEKIMYFLHLLEK